MPTEQFVWNNYLLKDIETLVHCDWLLHIIHGFVSQSSETYLISRTRIIILYEFFSNNIISILSRLLLIVCKVWGKDILIVLWFVLLFPRYLYIWSFAVSHCDWATF